VWQTDYAIPSHPTTWSAALRAGVCSHWVAWGHAAFTKGKEGHGAAVEKTIKWSSSHKYKVQSWIIRLESASTSRGTTRYRTSEMNHGAAIANCARGWAAVLALDEDYWDAGSHLALAYETKTLYICLPWHLHRSQSWQKCRTMSHYMHGTSRNLLESKIVWSYQYYQIFFASIRHR
jgi:hypothetical protein